MPLADIATIELRDDAKAPLVATAGAVVLNDGTIFKGRFVNLNLGVVETDGGEIDRSEVALIILEPTSLKPVAPPGDLLVFADGNQKSGRLASCDAASCRFDGELIPIERLRWIGLAEEGNAPPGAVATANQVWVDDKAIEARMSSIDATNVGTTHGKFARKRVSWIHLAEVSEEKPPTGAESAQEAPKPPAPPPVQPPQPPQPPQPQPPGAGGQTGGSPTAAPQGGTRGALWSGTIRARLWGTVSGITSNLDVVTSVKVREYAVPWLEIGSGKPLGTIRLLRSEGSVIHNTMRCSGPYLTCSGEGSVTVSTRDDDTQPSVIYLQTRAGRTDLEVPIGKELYVVGIPSHNESTYDITYRSNATSVEPMGYITPLIGRHPTLPLLPISDNQFRFVENGRMVGSYTAAASGAFEHVTVSWSICREGVQCSEPPPLPDDGGSAGSVPPPADKPDCNELQQLIDAMKQLKETYDGFEDDNKKAVADRDGVRDNIWGYSGALRKYFTAMLGLAGQGVSGTLGKLISVSKSLMGMSGEGNVQDVIKATKAIATDPLKDAAAKAAVNAAVQQAEAYLAQTGDDAGALRTYAAAIGKSEELASAGAKVAKGVNFASAVVDYAEKTNGLADLIQEWFEHNEEATRAQTQMDDINRRMDDLQKRITACRSGSAALRRDIQLAAFYATGATGTGDPAAIEARLRAARERLDAVPSQLEAAAPWLLPFFADATISPRLAAALLGKAVPELEAVKQTIDDAVAQGQSVESDLQRAIPQKAGAVKGGGGSSMR